MKQKLFYLSIVLMTATTAFSQTNFLSCYDSFSVKLKNDSMIDDNFMADWNNCLRGKIFPTFSLQTINGEKLETPDLKGKIIVFNLWFTSCQPCVAEIPGLNRLVKDYKDKPVVFIGLCTDKKQKVTEFLLKHAFDFITVPEADPIVDRIGVFGFPTTYIIDRKGKVSESWMGGRTDKQAEEDVYEKAKPIIDELLK